MDASPSDTGRLLRALAVRGFALALLIGMAADALLTTACLLTGLVFLRAPPETAAKPRQASLDEVSRAPRRR